MEEDDERPSKIKRISAEELFDVGEDEDEDTDSFIMLDDDPLLGLIHACRTGNLAVVKSIVKLRADVNAPYKMGFTPLHFACMDGHAPLVRFLIKRGARVNVVNKVRVHTRSLVLFIVTIYPLVLRNTTLHGMPRLLFGCCSAPGERRCQHGSQRPCCMTVVCLCLVLYDPVCAATGRVATFDRVRQPQARCCSIYD